MDTILKLCAYSLLAATVASLLKKHVSEFSVAGMAVGIFALTAVTAGVISGALEVLHKLADVAGVGDELFRPLIKCIGISIVTKIGADMCKDSGASSFGSYIELAGGAAAVIIISPLMLSLLSQITV